LSNFLSDHLIHRDEDFMVIHKPAGLLSVPGKGDLQDSVLTRLVAEPKTLLIHRLDRDTSGIWSLVYLNLANSYFTQFQDRQTQKFIKLWLLDI
jgi:tRNA pseudouridine32 synthase/23S rRNA pseudouridine746 synthase